MSYLLYDSMTMEWVVLMKTHGIVFQPLTSHTFDAGTGHTGFLPARLRFTRVILVASRHACIATLNGFYVGVLGHSG